MARQVHLVGLKAFTPSLTASMIFSLARWNCLSSSVVHWKPAAQVSGLSLKQILHIIFVVCVEDKTESFLQSSFPVDFILELIKIRLVANLAGENLFSK